MSRIAQCFKQLHAEGRKALIPFLTAGDPNLETTLELMHALVANGADIIELGFPFTDPTSDGPVIQRAVERALANNTSLKNVLATVNRFRQENNDTPVVLMGYLNPVECMGYQEFVNACIEVGVDGVLIVDMPPEESHDLKIIVDQTALDMIFLVAPTTSDERAKQICAQSSGYVYYVSLKGVTGAGNLDIESVKSNLARFRSSTDLPIGVGFGISDPQTAAQIAAIADAVVVGSALINKIAELDANTPYDRNTLQAHIALIREMRESMDELLLSDELQE
jgi:tryptophan synthase alpha chain